MASFSLYSCPGDEHVSEVDRLWYSPKYCGGFLCVFCEECMENYGLSHENPYGEDIYYIWKGLPNTKCNYPKKWKTINNKKIDL